MVRYSPVLQPFSRLAIRGDTGEYTANHGRFCGENTGDAQTTPGPPRYRLCMTEPSDHPAGWSWFTNLPLKDQTELLAHPSGELPETLVNRLLVNPGVGWWAWEGQPYRAMLSQPAVAKLRAVRRQLDDWWWNHLSPEERGYISEHRDAPLDSHYRHVINKASRDPATDGEDAYLVVLISDVQDNNRFRLPAMIRAYVEMVSA